MVIYCNKVSFHELLDGLDSNLENNFENDVCMEFEIAA